MSEFEKNVIPLPSAETIEAEAASWLTVLGREDVAEDDLGEFQRWLAQSERHRTAFTVLSATWDDLEILREVDDIAEAVIDLPVEKRSLFQRREFFALAACLALFVIAGGVYFLTQMRGATQSGVFVTAVGEQKTIELSDGSKVQLNTDSRIEVSFAGAARVVSLTQGEAHFSVAKDRRRPFFVYAASGVVEAVGTAFTVRLRVDDAVEVTVEEGRVALATLEVPALPLPAGREAPGRPPLAQLTAGQSAVFSKRVEQIEQMEQADLSRKLSWRQGMLAYAGDPLSEVIADISRYTDIDIEITDPALADLPVGGFFRVGETEALLDSLELTFGLKVDRIDKNHVRLSAPS